jgi:hypothetical protein
VALSRSLVNGNVACQLAAFVVVNSEGWALTAAHVVMPALALPSEVQRARDAGTRTRGGGPRTPPERHQRDAASDPRMTRAFSFWWGQDGATMATCVMNAAADIALVKLDGLDVTTVPAFPRFRDPSKPLRPGTSVCRLGYPFHEIAARYDEDEDRFTLPDDAVPPPLFPLEGIVTREAIAETSMEGGTTARFIETSSPGLRGQSGGPLFDASATVWGIQSQTRHYPLGFSPEIRRDGRRFVEEQFLNVGLAVHASVCIALMHQHGVAFELEG